MWEILCKILFFVSMLVAYAYVTSTNLVIIIVLAYTACVFCYYSFNNIQIVVDEFLAYFNFNSKFSDAMNTSQVSSYFVNRKYNKISNNNIATVNSKKTFSSLCNADNRFSKENTSLYDSNFDGCSAGLIKADFVCGIDLSPSVLKSNSYNRKMNKSGIDNIKLKNIEINNFSRSMNKSPVRQLSKLPRANSSPVVHIAPLESTSLGISNEDDVNYNEIQDEEMKTDSIIQVLKEISSRKRNYIQEEVDRNGSTPKKSRKTDSKNVTSSQCKRSHDDSSTDSIEDKSRKKRCDDSDRNIAKMMSYTSSISVLTSDFTWNNHSKKRKSSRIEKSRSESPENSEKLRKICKDASTEMQSDENISQNSDSVDTIKTNSTSMVTCADDHSNGVENENNFAADVDIHDAPFPDIMPEDGEVEYVRVVGGKILNRTNCMFRKKFINSKIDPISLVTIEPEYATVTSSVDDNILKENLLNNLINDIERKGEKQDSVIFYENSVIEEVAKNDAARKESSITVDSVKQNSNEISCINSYVETESNSICNSENKSSLPDGP